MWVSTVRVVGNRSSPHTSSCSRSRVITSPRWARTARTATTPRRLLPLREEAPDHRLGLLVVALADVPVADDPLAIDQERRRPGPDAPSRPDREVVVLHDRVPDSELLGGVHDLLVRLLPEELRAVHADDREAILFVALVPAPQLRDHVAAVDSAEGPEVHQHDPAAPARRGVAPGRRQERPRGRPPGARRVRATGRDAWLLRHLIVLLHGLSVLLRVLRLHAVGLPVDFHHHPAVLPHALALGAGFADDSAQPEAESDNRDHDRAPAPPCPASERWNPARLSECGSNERETRHNRVKSFGWCSRRLSRPSKRGREG